ncbi:hypothetical protein Hanom_Chr09g00791661 [Helianthus anomalus]
MERLCISDITSQPGNERLCDPACKHIPEMNGRADDYTPCGSDIQPNPGNTPPVQQSVQQEPGNERSCGLKNGRASSTTGQDLMTSCGMVNRNFNNAKSERSCHEVHDRARSKKYKKTCRNILLVILDILEAILAIFRLRRR